MIVIISGLKFEEVTRKLRDSERKIRELERKGSNQAEFDVKVAELQNEVEEKNDQVRQMMAVIDENNRENADIEQNLRNERITQGNS